MNFENEKYEFLLHTWGGFYNEEYKAKHGLEPGYFWFDTKEERESYLKNLKDIEEKLSAKYLATSFYEGKNTRYRTIVKMKFIYNGKAYPYEYDFGYGYDTESAHYMWKEGNYSCDCNRSLFLNREYPEVVVAEECGDTIKMRDFVVVQVK
jgi:hypothetical protein